jgi:hypothetical protein
MSRGHVLQLGQKSARPKMRRIKRPRVDADERVIADILCIKCGGSLQSQKIGEPCSQCGHAVSDSVYGDFLIHADRAAVRKLAEAARSVKAGAGLLGALVIVLLLLSVATARDFQHGVAQVFNAMRFGAFIVPLIAVIGMATLTQRYSLAYYRARYVRRSFLVRAGIAVAVLLVGVVVAAVNFPRIAQNLAITLWTVVPAAMFLHGVRRLMQRVPNSELAGYARVAFIGVLACGAALFAVLMLQSLGASDPDKQEMVLGFTIVCIIGGVMLGIGGYRLLARVEDVLFKAAR